MIAVRTAPAITPKIGFLNIRNNSWKAGTSLSPETAPVIVSIPNIRVANPRRTIPISFFLLLLVNIKSTIPMSARTGVKEEGFKSFRNILLPEIPLRLKIHAVTVVPILAPIITWIACLSVISFEFTKPTTITVVAEEL